MVWKSHFIKSIFRQKKIKNFFRFYFQSCENCIIEWKPGLLNENLEYLSRTNKNVFIFNQFEAKECDIWFVRFGVDFSHRVLIFKN